MDGVLDRHQAHFETTSWLSLPNRLVILKAENFASIEAKNAGNLLVFKAF